MLLLQFSSNSCFSNQTMTFNTSFAFPSWDKNYIQVLHAIVINGPCTMKTVEDCCYKQCSFVVAGLVDADAVAICGKRGRAKLYAATAKGYRIHAEALQTKELCEMLEFAKKFTSFVEFKLNCTLLGHSEWYEQSFIEQNVIPCFKPGATAARHSMKGKLQQLPFVKELVATSATSADVAVS